MLKQQQNKLKTVQLTEGILVHTALDNACIPALRSGFAGYPVNPRWNAVKYHAWKTGRQWRTALSQGDMAVRSADSMLVSASEIEPTTDSEVPRRSNEKTSRSFLSHYDERSGELTLA